MTLTIKRIAGVKRLAGTGKFHPVAHLGNRYRPITVIDAGGGVAYSGVAYKAARYLPEGTYRFLWEAESEAA